MSPAPDPPPRLERACREAIARGASDLLLHEDAPPRVRVEGRLSTLDVEPVPRDELLALVERLSHGGDGPIDAQWALPCGRFRVSLFRHLGAIGAALRVVKTAVGSPDELGIPAPLRDWVEAPHGLLLICGPTGAGKSTTAAALLEWLNQRSARHVVTIEDPVEYLFASRRCLFTQKEVPVDVPSFADGLRSALRQSPDVLFVGEIRDFETANIALQAAETGHLVMSTLHCATATEGLERLTHLMPPELRPGSLALLAEQLVAVVAQKLVPGTDGRRVLAAEILANAGVTRKWIRDGAHSLLRDHLDQQAGPPSRSFLTDLLALYRSGRISEEEARRACPHPAGFDRALQGISSR